MGRSGRWTGEGPRPPAIRWGAFLLGDAVEEAFSTVGITKERVEAVLKRRCNCPERQQFLNRLGIWAQRVLGGKTEDAEKYLDEITEEMEKAADREAQGKEAARRDRRGEHY